jgi:hypothetical protein
MKRKIRKDLEDILDDFLKQYLENHGFIYGDSKQREILYHKEMSQINRSWKKSRDCMFSGCTNKSIRKSHSIQKNSSLRLISENGKVLAEKIDIKRGKLQEIGLNEASTFPGFCQEHEKLFSEFERKKDIVERKDITRQIYRTLCRELVRIDFKIYWYKKHLERHKQQLKEYFDNQITYNFDSLTSQNIIKNSSIKLTNDKVDIYFNSEIKELIELKQVLNKYHKNQLESAILNKHTYIAVTYLSVDFTIPVCLAGLIQFNIIAQSIKNRICAIANVLPFKNKTLVVLFGRREDGKYISDYLAQFASDTIALLNLIETWMIYETAHWFIKPSVWNTITRERKRKIISDLVYIGFPFTEKEYKIGQYPGSIFDELRIELIKDAKSKMNTTGKENYFVDIIKKESLKLKYR